MVRVVTESILTVLPNRVLGMQCTFFKKQVIHGIEVTEKVQELVAHVIM